MKLLQNEKIIKVMQETLNYVDSRLVDHGRRISYAVYKVLKARGTYTRKQIRDMCILSMLHDIGAYKTEEIDKMTQFEAVNIWEHSIYGFLFIKYFSPIKELAPALMFHHANCGELEYLHPSLRELAQIIYLCDRADVYSSVHKDKKDLRAFLEQRRDKKFLSEVVDLFYKADIDFSTLYFDMENDREFIEIFYEDALADEEADAYLKMIILSIDFRSNQTVMHTLAATRASKLLAQYAGLSGDEIEEIVTGMLLHDIGKVGVPTAILEKPDRLEPDEMEIMKTHVLITERIISGSVGDTVKKIAIRHHEKLNGTGYPYGVSAGDLTVSERIVAVADIFSALYGSRSYKDAYPREKIVRIFRDMSEKGLIDSEITELAVNRFDDITSELQIESKPVLEAYKLINREYAALLKIAKTMSKRVSPQRQFIR